MTHATTHLNSYQPNQNRLQLEAASIPRLLLEAESQLTYGNGEGENGLLLWKLSGIPWAYLPNNELILCSSGQPFLLENQDSTRATCY